MALAEQADLIVQLSVRDNMSRGIAGAQARVRQLERDFSRTSAALGRTVQNFKLLGLAAAGGVAVTVKAFGDFEDALATINTVANLTDEQLGAVGEQLRLLSMDTGLALSDITSGYYDLVSAGVQAKDAQMVLTNATTLAIGGLGTTAETVDLLTTAINSYGLKAGQVTEVTNGFAQAIAAGKVTAAELAGSFATVAPIAANAGIGIEELQAGYAQLTARGVPAAEAATQMRAAIVALKRPTTDLSKLQQKLGVNFAQVAKQKGLQVAYQQLMQAAKDAGISETQLLGRVEALGYAYSVTGKNAQSYRKNLEAVRNSSDGAGVATEQFQKRQRTFNRTIDRVRRTLNDIGIEVGSIFAPAIQRAAEVVLQLVRDNRQPIQDFADSLREMVDAVTTKEDIAAKLQDALDFLDTIDWSAIGAGLSITGQAAKLAVDAFNHMPKELQQALITLIAANKLTGGFVSGFVGDLVGVALRSLTTVNAVNVTVIGQNVTGGDKGPPIPGGGGPFDLFGPIGTMLRGLPIIGEALRIQDAATARITTTNAFNALPEATRKQFFASGGTLEQVMSTGTAAQASGQSIEDAIRDLVTKQADSTNRLIPSIMAAQQNAAAQLRAQVEQKNAFYNMYDEMISSGKLSAEQKQQLERIAGKIEAGKITAEEGNRRLGKIDERLKAADTSVNVTVNASTNVNVADVGEKIVVARGGGRILIR